MPAMIRVGSALVRVMVLNSKSSDVKCSKAITNEDNVAPEDETEARQDCPSRLGHGLKKRTVPIVHMLVRPFPSHAP